LYPEQVPVAAEDEHHDDDHDDSDEHHDDTTDAEPDTHQDIGEALEGIEPEQIEHIQDMHELIVGSDSAQPAVDVAAMVQKKMVAVAAAYLQTHQMKLVIPTNFAQTAISDDKLQQRAHEWLDALSIAFLDSKQEWEGVLEKRAAHGTELADDAEELEEELNSSHDSLKNTLDFIKDAVENLDSVLELFNGIAEQNSQVVQANKDYCSVERQNYDAVAEGLENQVTTYKDIRTYFMNHYSDVADVLKERYQ